MLPGVQAPAAVAGVAIRSRALARSVPERLTCFAIVVICADRAIRQRLTDGVKAGFGRAWHSTGSPMQGTPRPLEPLRQRWLPPTPRARCRTRNSPYCLADAYPRLTGRPLRRAACRPARSQHVPRHRIHPPTRRGNERPHGVTGNAASPATRRVEFRVMRARRSLQLVSGQPQRRLPASGRLCLPTLCRPARACTTDWMGAQVVVRSAPLLAWRKPAVVRSELAVTDLRAMPPIV